MDVFDDSTTLSPGRDISPTSWLSHAKQESLSHGTVEVLYYNLHLQPIVFCHGTISTSHTVRPDEPRVVPVTDRTIGFFEELFIFYLIREE